MAQELEGFSEEELRVVVEYWWHMAHIPSDSEKALPFCFHFGCFAKHPLTREDRLGNKDLDFPIGICFGEQDWLGSSGADYIVKNNKYFEEGRSQLFVIPNSDHLTYCDNPEETSRIMIGFLNQTIKHTFQEKPRQGYIT
jgi:pimeloyl-ACP methyl ester carboxylesterase